jgi:hypothetical protein
MIEGISESKQPRFVKVALELLFTRATPADFAICRIPSGPPLCVGRLSSFPTLPLQMKFTEKTARLMTLQVFGRRCDVRDLSWRLCYRTGSCHIVNCVCNLCFEPVRSERWDTPVLSTPRPLRDG